MSATEIKFVIGSRKLFSVSRELSTISFSLSAILKHPAPESLTINQEADGFRILSAPADFVSSLTHRYPDYVVGGYQSYRRFYIDMAGSYGDYLARFSAKTRSGFKRKKRKLVDHFAGAVQIRTYRTQEEIAEFLDHAIPLSQRTYQSRLLDAGLPESDAARAEMMALAEKDAVRAYLLFADGKPVSYLYLPIHDGVISYAFLGYDPEISSFSPGTILQLDALESLFAEGKYRYFDFTEGEGAHKEMFGTHHVEACSFLLLRGSFANRALVTSLNLFDGTTKAAKNFAQRSGALARIRKLLKG
jgi:CelD/BcsL family acetyltransferase involved in cellulose biosynthesis